MILEVYIKKVFCSACSAGPLPLHGQLIAHGTRPMSATSSNFMINRPTSQEQSAPEHMESRQRSQGSLTGFVCFQIVTENVFSQPFE